VEKWRPRECDGVWSRIAGWPRRRPQPPASRPPHYEVFFELNQDALEPETQDTRTELSFKYGDCFVRFFEIS